MEEKTDQNPEPRSGLQIPRQEAEIRIDAQIRKGFDLQSRVIKTPDNLEEAREEKRRWDQFNTELLKRITDSEQFLNGDYPPVFCRSGEAASFGGQKEQFLADVRNCIRELSSIKDRLVLLYELNHFRGQTISELKSLPGDQKKIFIVHGHDQESKYAVARFLERVGLDFIILHEQPNQGRTIIEKFEDYSEVGFAVVLLTPDDLGGGANDPEGLNPRARQNVIFELGFMIGALGRQRVCALHKGEVEIPSDYSGVLWIRMDREGAWQLKLAREIKAAGIELDLNKLL